MSTSPTACLLLALGLALAGRRRLGRPGLTPRGRVNANAQADLASQQYPKPARLLPLVAGLGAGLLAAFFGGRLGLLAALPAAVAAAVLTQRRLKHARPAGPDLRAVAFALDLLACSLTAGAPVELAIAGVATAAGQYGSGPLRQAVEPLGLVGRLLRLGTDPARAWAVLNPLDGMAPVAAAGRRCADSGARLAGALTAAAAELRDQHRAAAVARAERIGVWALLPLGCCFLPAFVCIGVVPVIAGVAGQVFSG